MNESTQFTMQRHYTFVTLLLFFFGGSLLGLSLSFPYSTCAKTRIASGCGYGYGEGGYYGYGQGGYYSYSQGSYALGSGHIIASGTFSTPDCAPAQCNNGVDNDGDGLIDMSDPGCSSTSDSNEGSPLNSNGSGCLIGTNCTSGACVGGVCIQPQCSDGIDNDSDGRIDHPADPECASSVDTSEALAGSQSGSPPQCSDGFDNDGDGQTDLADVGCANASDGDERNACSDGIDNDGDGFVDYPADPGCSSASDNNEVDPTKPIFKEVVPE